MIDFHIHVLPGIDDGSKDTATSVRMLEASAAYGVDTVCATSHFYAQENSIGKFLARRKTAYERLMEALEDREDLPRLRLGAEVLYFAGISTVDGLEELCLEGTDLLLLEMPFVRWTEHMLREVKAIRQRGLQPVAAHIERYMSFQPRKLMDSFFDLGTFIQCNASFFTSRRTARYALGMLRRGEIQFLGSDAHNMTGRPPELGAALAVIERKLGVGAAERFMSDAEFLVADSEERVL